MSDKVPEDDLNSARSLIGWGFISFIFWSLIFLLCGCSQNEPPFIPVTPPLNLKPIEEEVGNVGVFGGNAKEAIGRAILEANKANFNLQVIKQDLKQADFELEKQQSSLNLANLEIKKAREASEGKEQEIRMLHEANVKWQAEAQKYKIKYERLKKYKWAIICICGWLVIKIAGSLGAWTPQGRIIKGLIG